MFDYELVSKMGNSGVDILLIGNYLDKPMPIEKIVNMIEELVKEGRVTKERVLEASKRIRKLTE